MPHSTKNTQIPAYLDGYAEKLALPQLPHGHYQQVLIIPAYKESADFIESVLPGDAEDLLVIVVLNAPPTVTPADLQRTTQILAHYPFIPLNENYSFYRYNQQKHVDVLVVNRADDNRLPVKQGVGLARKIGNDLALSLIYKGTIINPWIYNTDADTNLPDGYFLAPLSGVACVFPFRHFSPYAQLQNKVNLYELHIRYYIHGLAHAGSPYAFQSLGSTIVISANAYAMARGFPRRPAGEDFYLLNKLAKLGDITQLTAPSIIIAGRLSDRVPFGTGPALARMPMDSETYLSYHPQVFNHLARFQKSLNDCPDFSRAPLTAAPSEWLAAIGFEQALDNLCSATKSPSRWRRSLIEWFDGFRTLKFVHEARKHLPDQPLLQTVRDLLGCQEAPAELLSRLQNLDRSPFGTALN